ncbi:unnamed protein product [Parnassius apollo]|uniref:(apollo) hypothetical protein n=1 Tax=Parnassius apollo TaxID=110799 RepID=A0A8S3X816_PARAO|nr:unnamed protein product [Parnassius apollo]
MSDPSSEEAWERLMVESLLKLSGEHSVTHHEPLQPVVMQPVKPRTFPVQGPTDRLSYVIWRYDDGAMGLIPAHCLATTSVQGPSLWFTGSDHRLRQNATVSA